MYCYVLLFAIESGPARWWELEAIRAHKSKLRSLVQLTPAYLQLRFDLDPPVPLHNTVYLGCQQTNITVPDDLVRERSQQMSDPR